MKPGVGGSAAFARNPYAELRAFGFLPPPSALRSFAGSRFWLALYAALTSDRDVEVESGLGGRLETRGLPLGGSGKALMLVVLRRVLPGVGMPDEDGPEGDCEVLWSAEVSVVLTVGTEGVERALDGADVSSFELVNDREGDLEPGRGIEEFEPCRRSDESGMPGNGFLVLGTGNAGKGPDGGASGDVEGRRIPDIVEVADADMVCCRYPSLKLCSIQGLGRRLLRMNCYSRRCYTMAILLLSSNSRE